MGKLRDRLKDFAIFRILYYPFVRRKMIKAAIENARIEYQNDNEKKGSFDNYVKDAMKYGVNYSEWRYQFNFWNKTESERSEYMSGIDLSTFYSLYLHKETEKTYFDKTKFLRKYKDFIHRSYIDVAKCEFNEFKDLVSKSDVIIKPKNSFGGNGIYKIPKQSKVEESLILSLFEKLKSSEVLIEECIENIDSVKAFHPASLNTIRIITVRNGRGDITTLDSFIRFGTGGNVVDNGGRGGILAGIDIPSGSICTDGIDKRGNKYVNHPDTNLRFKGTVLERFDEMVQTCKDAHKLEKNAKVIGWDILVRDNGIIEIIEGNHRPDAVEQMLWPTGFRKRLKKLIL